MNRPLYILQSTSHHVTKPLAGACSNAECLYSRSFAATYVGERKRAQLDVIAGCQLLCLSCQQLAVSCRHVPYSHVTRENCSKRLADRTEKLTACFVCAFAVDYLAAFLTLI